MKIGSQELHIVLRMPGGSARLEPSESASTCSSGCIAAFRSLRHTGSERLRDFQIRVTQVLGALVPTMKAKICFERTDHPSIPASSLGCVRFDVATDSSERDNKIYRKKAPLPHLTFKELLAASPSQMDIIKTLNGAVSQKLWAHYQAIGFRSHIATAHYTYALQSVKTIIGAFDHVLSQAIEMVIQAELGEIGLLYIDLYFRALLTNSFTFDEDLEELNKKDVESFESLHDRKVHDLCLPFVNEIVEDPTFREVLERFFKKTLEQELASNKAFLLTDID